MARNQTGFITLPIAAWGAIAAAVVIGGLLLALKVQNSRLDSAQADLEACASRYAETLKSVAKSNAAVDALREDSEKRRKQAVAALAKAREGQGSLNAEIERLRGINAAALDCSGAVAAAKQGMK